MKTQSSDHRTHFKYLYGPVYSWRLGQSMGIDPISHPSKICNFDCIYCQLGKTVQFRDERKKFIKVDELMKEIHALPLDLAIDHFTFSGRGEPTLAMNLGEMIRALKEVRLEKIAVITNSVLLKKEDVRDDLSLADYVLAKLDCCSQESLAAVDKAVSGIRFRKIIKGIMLFKESFAGKFALQIMFVEENKSLAPELARLAALIAPDEIQLNTPLRPSGARPLGRQDMEEIKGHFKGLPVFCVYDAPLKDLEPLNLKDTLRRRGAFPIK